MGIAKVPGMLADRQEKGAVVVAVAGLEQACRAFVDLEFFESLHFVLWRPYEALVRPNVADAQ